MISPIQECESFRKRETLGKIAGGLAQSGFKTYSWFKKVPSEYLEQAPEAGRNLELIIENLIPLALSKPTHARLLARAVVDWHKKYTSAQKLCERRDYYLLTTQEDAKIPFDPKQDTHYAHILSNIALAARAASDIPRYRKPRNFEYLTRCFHDLNTIAEEVFHAYPTRGPRDERHNRLSLSVIQKYDPPLNGAPSLHIAYSALLYNVMKAIGLCDHNSRAWESVEKSTYGMPRAVLAIKQHCCADVAFGLIAARMVFERRFKKHKFDDLTNKFCELEKRDENTPYSHIKKIHDELLAMRRGQSLKNLAGEYISKHNFPKLPYDHPKAYFDTRAKKIRLFQ